MNIAERLSGWLDAAFGLSSPAERAFVLGPAVVDRAETIFGHDPTTYAPSSYGEYLATSVAVYTASNIRATLLASLPLRLYRLDGNGDRTEITEGPAVELFTQVNPHWTARRLWRMTELSLCQWGSCFWFLSLGGRSGLPREIWWAKPDRVRVIPHPRDYVAGFLYDSWLGGSELAFKPNETAWLRYPNPLDEFAGLPPFAAAKLSADLAISATKSNNAMFRNGVQLSGIVSPGEAATTWQEEEVKRFEEALARRFTGADKAHRTMVTSQQLKWQQMSMTPKDAEFIESLRLSLEDVSRAYGVPLDLLGGQRTYANVEASERMVWTHTIVPEADFLAHEISEQILPMFGNLPRTQRPDLAEFDVSGVSVLQEDETAKWTIRKEQIQTGFTTINRELEKEGEEPLPWGDVWWAPTTLVPIESAALPEPALPDPLPQAAERPQDEMELSEAPDDDTDETESAARRRRTRQVAYGSPEHEQRWRAFVGRTEPHEATVAEATVGLLRRQRQAVLANLRAERGAGTRSVAEAVEEPFDLARWVRTFRTTIRPILREIVEDAGTAELAALPAVSTVFDVKDPNVVKALYAQAQRFAVEVNQTTWDALKASLGEGLTAGETMADLAERVEIVMAGRIRSSAETIARTEVTAAYNLGTLESWRQSGVVRAKTWLAALDSRVRDTHAAAHGQTVPLDADFRVGAATGPAPGQMSSAAETVNCRCSMTAVLDTEIEPRAGMPATDRVALSKLLTILELPALAVNGQARGMGQ